MGALESGQLTPLASRAFPPPGHSRVSADPLDAVMAVSAVVAEAGGLDETLEQIAVTAASLVGAKACVIYLRESR